MATLVLGAIGTLVGGPIIGAVGALIGREVDHALIGSPKREGPRLKELAVTTSSYGMPIPRQHGRVRAPGSLIWATELTESSESTGGGKGQPSVTSYSYSASFAVALSSRPILRLGRIWADGNLLRGEAGDLKVGGSLRLYHGYGDQPADPLIVSDRGSACPAFRHTAYVVFEDLQLADFGNRIPALTFEIVADHGEVTLVDLIGPLDEPLSITRSLGGLQGFSLEGGPLDQTLAALAAAWPIALDAGGAGLALHAADVLPPDPPLLPLPAAARDEDGFGKGGGIRRLRGTGEAAIPDTLRYYDTGRDYLSGLQRADGRARAGQGAAIELPASLSAETARVLVNAAAERAGWARETLEWRLAELDPSLAPGSVVRAPGHAGNWRIAGWEWDDEGVTLELVRLPRGPARQPDADSGTVLTPPDELATPTLLHAFELPWDGLGNGNAPKIFAALSSAGGGWSGAALYADHGGVLTPLGGSGSRRSVIGQTSGPLAPSPALLLERDAAIEVELVSGDFALSGAAPESLANGANRALLGGEVIQFARAEALGGSQWRLTGLLRGRGGTEGAAQAGHSAGARFVLLDHAPIALDPAKTGPASGTNIVAIGLADPGPVSDAIANPGIALRPLTPVHPRTDLQGDGSIVLGWTRRARGGWNWPDEVELPLAEPAETYRVGLGPAAAPLIVWEVNSPALTVAAAIVAAHPGAQLWVRQVGGFAVSDPLLLTILPT